MKPEHLNNCMVLMQRTLVLQDPLQSVFSNVKQILGVFSDKNIDETAKILIITFNRFACDLTHYVTNTTRLKIEWSYTKIHQQEAQFYVVRKGDEFIFVLSQNGLHEVVFVLVVNEFFHMFVVKDAMYECTGKCAYLKLHLPKRCFRGDSF